MLRTLLVDDHDVVLRGLAAVIAGRPDWQVIGQAHNSRDAIRIAQDHCPDVAIIDLRLDDMDGIELTRHCLALCPTLRVLIFTMHKSEATIRDALAAGARGILLKSELGRSLDAALDAMEAGEPYLPGRRGEIVLNSHLGRSSDPNRLTPREREVMMQIVSGISGKEIASALSISPKTVEIHRTSLMRKLKLRNAVELVRYAVRNGFLEP
ncbi:DNA-binding response regulator [Pseudomonas sp. AOB-7]|uniref:response regulator n=1 Tax=Pseudomonas sp. AOB-7 TaxID=2482750 RepID=UPI000EFA6CE7|nr:response regulator transcription factor [Pseudomonas sp. AOB-7]RMH81796.1 DNA-binding response regulator [Pseudomonas sp. AOB-7]